MTLYYDVASPYAFVAFRHLQRLSPPIALNLRPVSLALLMKTTKNQPPASVKAKQKWLLADLQRAAAEAGLDHIKIPRTFPIRTAMALRVLTALRDDPDALKKATGALFESIFLIGDFDDNLDDIERILSRVLPKATIAKAKAANEAMKSLLQATTEEALAKGAFGVPTMIVKSEKDSDGEFFFGSDRFHQIARLLNRSWPPMSSKI